MLTPPTTRSARSRPRPTGRAARSRPPRRRCCARTGSARVALGGTVGDHRRPAAGRARHAVPDRRREGVEAAAADLPGVAVGDRRPRLRAGDARGGRLEQPLLLCLDEAGNVAPLPNLAEIASTAPSHNIQLVSIFHDLAQARSRYGRQAETVVNSHRARMLLPGSPTSTRCATSPGWSARRRRATDPRRPAPAGG